MKQLGLHHLSEVNPPGKQLNRSAWLSDALILKQISKIDLCEFYLLDFLVLNNFIETR